ncbi:MAG: galactosyltransferase-related protein [Allomuricauda sp.]
MSIPISKRLYVIDNSRDLSLKELFTGHDEIHYLWTGENLGFGKGHNLILDKLESSSKFHIILNPDISFQSDAVMELMNYAKDKEEIGIVAPLVEFPNGQIQYSFRRNPKPFDLIIRRVPFLKQIFKRRYQYSHYLYKDLSKPFLVDSVMGCFQMFRTSVFKSINGFDDRYFMYMEDIDICRKVYENDFEVVIYPHVKIIHHLEQGSATSFKLFKIHVQSAFRYFKKWS